TGASGVACHDADQTSRLTCSEVISGAPHEAGAPRHDHDPVEAEGRGWGCPDGGGGDAPGDGEIAHRERPRWPPRRSSSRPNATPEPARARRKPTCVPPPQVCQPPPPAETNRTSGRPRLWHLFRVPRRSQAAAKQRPLASSARPRSGGPTKPTSTTALRSHTPHITTPRRRPIQST